MTRQLRWLGVLLACCGCVEPAADRAERDETIGHSSAADVDVDVAGGLAAVRELDEGRLHLWENAPSLDIRLESGRVPRTLELFVENCMPKAVLSVKTGQVAIENEPRARPTACRFKLKLASRVSELRLADPAADERGIFHFGVLSDIQEGLDRVHKVYVRINQEPQLAFLLGVGDLTHDGTVAQVEKFQNEMKSLNIPYYVTVGNHDVRTAPPPYQDYFGRCSSSFLFRGVRFTLLDSGSFTVDKRVYDLLDGWLDLGQSQVHVVATHVPPFDPTGTRNGDFNSRNEAAALLGKLASGDVDLTLYGHIHSYWRFRNAGIEAHISGGGGGIPEHFDTMGRHFLDVTVSTRGVQDVRVVRVDK